MAGHIQKGLNAFKFVPNEKGPYVIKEAYDSGYYWIAEPGLEELYLLLIKWLKLNFLRRRRRIR